MDLERLRKDMKNIDWSPVCTANDINTMVEYLTTALIKINDMYAPIRPVRIKLALALWLSVTELNTANKTFLTPTSFSKCKILRKLCKRMCLDVKRRYIHDSEFIQIIQSQV
ncbi:unnamed protein product [Euphydryas editha]|uniref:Uncharacterized protein n=1 Tax=Euphydryas editha TaxID=104508 RepID=A0AAU9UY02_EUPED|nr:unnamed protein product [Euphydryas editha]